MTDAPQTWSVIILAYNEEATLRTVFAGVDAQLGEMPVAAREIVIVDDGSTDSTPLIAAALAEGRDDVRVILHGVNKGIGEGLLTGWNAAQYENILAVPGDGQFDIQEARPFAHLPPRTLVSFTRASNASYTPFRRALSAVNRRLNKHAVGMDLADVNWVKLFKREDFQAVTLTLRSSLVQSELCAKLIANGCAVLEPPSAYLERVAGEAKGASLRTIARAGRETFALMTIMARHRAARRRAAED